MTALLVQDGGVAGTVFNLLGLLLVGIAAERRLGPRSWLLAYLVGALTGELVGWSGWQPIGAGNSVGVCGLAGTLSVAALRATDPPGRLEIIAPATWAAALASPVLTPLAPAAVALGCGALVLRGPRLARPALAGVVAVAALVLLIRRDIHGAALAAGLGVGSGILGHAGARDLGR